MQARKSCVGGCIFLKNKQRKDLKNMALDDFINNIAIKQLASRPFWTINKEKMPVDFYAFKNTGKIYGATGPESLATLYEILDFFMNLDTPMLPSTFVYSLDCKRDNIVILDIESKCPENIKQKFFSQLPFCYADVSMSGKGMHMMFPCPELDEITEKKIVMKEEHGYYEILLNHYCSFTLNTIYTEKGRWKNQNEFLNIWNELKSKQKICTIQAIDFDKNFKIDKKRIEPVVTAVASNMKVRILKTPSDYENDYSRYEYAMTCVVKNALEILLGMPLFASLNITFEEKLYIIYLTVKDIVPYRPKHDEIRDDMPWLIYLAYRVYVQSYN